MIRRAAIATVLLCWAALIGLACRPLPDPVTPPGPSPVEPLPPVDPPGPTPAATSCERAAARYVVLCPNPKPAASFAATCESYSAQAGSSPWNPQCMERAPDCDALWRCRGGTQ